MHAVPAAPEVQVAAKLEADRQAKEAERLKHAELLAAGKGAPTG